MKIVIFGIVASGKTTLAKQLSQKLGIPYFEGDCIAWGFAGEPRFKRTDQQQEEAISAIDQNPSWIIEGTYRQSQRLVYELADQIIFLDTPLYLRRARIAMRFIKQTLGLEHSHYKPTLGMLKQMYRWTRDFEQNRSTHEKRLLGYGDKLIWVHSAKQLKNRDWARPTNGREK